MSKAANSNIFHSKWLSLTQLLLMSLITGFLSLCFSTGTHGAEMLNLYFANPYIIILNVLPPMLISLFLFFAVGRAWICFIVSNAAVMVPTFVNYFKLAFRGDAFVAEDITLISESQKMLESYKLFFTRGMLIYVCFFVACSCVLFFLFRGKFASAVTRILGAAATLIICITLIFTVYFSDGVYTAKTQNNSIINQYDSTELFVSKGFVYPFIYSIKTAMPTPVKNYSDEYAESILARYKTDEAQTEPKINIIGIMLEAFNDFSNFEQLTFINNPYEKYKEIEAQSISGRLVTDIFAGNTRVSERQFMTGMQDYGTLSRNTNSFAWQARDLGYYAEGYHPCYAWFYDREEINANLGFENYYFSENYFKAKTGGDITYDSRLFPILLSRFKERETNKPYFSFSVTYQGHGPYEADISYYESPYIENKGYSASDYNIINNYIFTNDGTVGYLSDYVNSIASLDEPCILVVFGDHKPWLGIKECTYAALGIDIDTSSKEGFYNYYSTRYFIYANESAKKITGNDFVGDGPDMGPYFLMSLLYDAAGQNTDEYTRFLSHIRTILPVIHESGRFINSSGELVTEEQLTNSEKTALAEYRVVEYYRKTNFAYSRLLDTDE